MLQTHGKHFAVDESTYIIPIDIGRMTQGQKQYSKALIAGLLQQRFIHRRYATTDKNLYVMLERWD